MSDRPQNPGDALAAAALVACTLFWAGNFLVARLVRADFEPIPLNFLRWSLALLLFLPFAWSALRTGWPALRRDWLYVLALGAAGVAGFQTLLYKAVFDAPVIDVVLIVAAAPAAVLLGDSLVRRAAPSRAAMTGVALSFAGAVVLIAKGDLDRLLGLSFSVGQLWMTAAVLVWTAYTLLLRRAAPDLPPFAALAGSMAAGVVLMAPIALPDLIARPPDLTRPELLAALAYFAVAASALALAFWTFGVGRLGPVRAGLFMNLTPVFGAGLAVLLLGERPGLHHLAGAALIAAGLWWVNRPGPPRATARPAAPPPRNPAA